MENEDPADLGDDPGLVDDESRDGRSLLVGQLPVEAPVEVPDRHVAVDQIRAVALAPDSDGDDVVLVGNFADDLLDDVFQRDDAHQRPVLVDDQREVFVPAPEGLELIEQRRRFGDEPGPRGDPVDPEQIEVAGMRADGAGELPGMKHADDIVGIAAP